MDSRGRFEQGKRLRQAREARHYADAADAARAMGIPLPTYYNHENGSNGLSRSGARYAKFFKVNYDWLMNGRGQMLGPIDGIPVRGLVGAGAGVEISAIDEDGSPDTIELPESGRLGAFIVRGDSMWPRFMPGEYILFDEEPSMPDRLIGRYAVVQTLDGRRMIKQVQRGRGDGRWLLVSHNAPPEQDVQLVGAWRVHGVLMP
jgi:phage repressor protein C with HTH and peptisase S24 domain